MNVTLLPGDIATHEQSARILQHITNHWVSCCVYAAAKLNIADLLATGPQSITSLAGATATHPPSLYRLLRLLAANDLFEEISPEIFDNTAASTALISDIKGGMKEFVLAELGEFYLPWGNLVDSIRTGKTAFDEYYGGNLWDFYKTHQAEGLNFMKAMTNLTQFSEGAILERYDFSAFSTITDVGGGNGALLMAILKRTPEARGIVFDEPYVVKETAHLIAADPKVKDRCATAGGNFFVEVPAGADAYVIKYILHDWSDEDAIRILSNCSRAMKKDSKILVIDGVVPEGNAPHASKLMDMNMLALTGGRERTAAEFESIFLRSGLRLTRVIDLSISEVSIVEGKKV
ncbi:methyltransferase [Chitinophaga sp. Ak27]|uniref:methyltransferase n=1 Tax=Chitinophaga sp. Ak27 TaxID=2726116 RepID=UPI00145D5558|nr:methyltransferase [Chitinophaga sp. Ak27]NLU92394.1 methyltransferase [Chitinophaga sp. Ak27]